MKVTISFGNPPLAMLYTASMLAIGWYVGSHYGRTPTSGWILLFGIVLLLLHDACLAVLFGIGAAKIASSAHKKGREVVHTTAESSQPSHQEPHDAPFVSRNLYEGGVYRYRQRPQDYLDLAIEEMEFSVRTHNALKNADIQTVQELVQCSEGDLIDARLSPMSIREIKVTLDIVGLQLRLDSNRIQEQEEE
jgi:hypothetical protein